MNLPPTTAPLCAKDAEHVLRKSRRRAWEAIFRYSVANRCLTRPSTTAELTEQAPDETRWSTTTDSILVAKLAVT